MNNSFIYSKYFDIIFFHWLKASDVDQLWEMGAMDNNRLQGVTRNYRGLQGVTRGYKGFQEVKGGYKRFQKVTRDYKRFRGF